LCSSARLASSRGVDRSDETLKEYYDRRAAEYDDAYMGRGRWPFTQAPGLEAEIPLLKEFVGELAPAPTLDVACGTGFLTRFLRGRTVATDFSSAMLGRARARDAADDYVRADALALPFATGSFERVFSSHFYGRLELDDRLRFLSDAKRVARTFVVIDSPFQPDRPAEGKRERELLDGSKYVIYKKYFRPEELVEEIGGGRIVFSTSWFVAVEREW
jgi:demethylmenaquinone methyltransferase/2-methoxy-6-polyprenyl-1,4-benzoquinol methylase